MWTDLNVWKMLRNTSIRAQILEEGVSGGNEEQGKASMRAREWEQKQNCDQIERKKESRGEKRERQREKKKDR